METENCACGRKIAYENCCGPFHLKLKSAPNAEALMRSRYTAFVVKDADYLVETTHPGKRPKKMKTEYLKTAKETNWIRLEVLFSSIHLVEFKAFYLNKNAAVQIHHEKSNFKFEEEHWYYVDGEFY